MMMGVDKEKKMRVYAAELRNDAKRLMTNDE